MNRSLRECLPYDKALKRQINGLPGKLRQEAKRRIADLAHAPCPAEAIELRGYPNVLGVTQLTE